MKKLIVVLTVFVLAGLTYGQTDLDLDQAAPTNNADVWQSDAGPSNVGGVTYTMIDQIAGISNDVEIKQLNRKSDIELTQSAGTTNEALIYQRGNYDNHFYINGTATGGYNKVDVQLGQVTGGDIHGNDWYVDQTATGNNDLVISSLGNHVYSNGGIDIDQVATNGNNVANINQDGDWRRHVKIKSDQYSEDNELQGIIRGQHVDIDIDQDAVGTNYAKFEVQGNNVVLDAIQNTTFGSNTFNSYQEASSSAVVNQMSTLGNNTADVNQTN